MLLVCMMLPAAQATDLTQPVELHIEYKAEDVPIVGAPYRIYRVADMDEDCRFTLVDPFNRYPVSADQEDNEGWHALALTLSAFIAQDRVAPLKEGTTDENGMLSFTDLQSGLYLVLGSKYAQDGQWYLPDATLISLPNKNEADEWESSVHVSPKFDVQPGAPISLKVVKIWDDKDAESFRPENLIVQLLGNEEVYEEVLLSDHNNWQYLWEELDGTVQWQAIEKNLPDGYKVTTTREGNTIFIKNYHAPGKPDPELPQTGLTWWPVPVLAVSGMALFFIGWLKRRCNEG